MEHEIKKDLAGFFKDHPELKYIFLGGKGGVGKSVLAGSVAIWLGDQGKKTLLASTNPVHSLSSLLRQDVFGTETLIQETKTRALEIDTSDAIAEKKREIKEKIEWFLKYADISGQKTEDFIDSATMNPAFEESAMFEKMVDLMFEDKYDVYVFDTAPTANARRLLGMSKVYNLWVEKMLASRKEAATLKKTLSFTRKDEKDPLLDYLQGFRERIEKAHGLLTSTDLTAFFFATLPESLPIAVIRRFIGWFKEFGIPVGGVIVNGVIDKSNISEDTHEFVLNRVATQEKYLDEIFSTFSDVRAIVPRFEQEVRGVPALRNLTTHLFP